MTSLPARPGLAFKPEHFDAIREAPALLGFLEVHAENYMVDGGPRHRQLEALRRDHALSLHGVGLSLGGPGPLDRAHLARLKTLVARYQPASFSEHLAWSSHEGHYLNDLLPLPYTPGTLRLLCDHVDQTQDCLGRRILLENPATYLRFAQSTLPESAFLAEIARRTGCGLLLDLNNLLVSAINHRQDPVACLDAFPLDAVEEVHLAGHAREALPSGPLLIDDHGGAVAEPVWALLDRTLDRRGPLPLLIEWDNRVPAFPVLLTEARRAARHLDRRADSVRGRPNKEASLESAR